MVPGSLEGAKFSVLGADGFVGRALGAYLEQRDIPHRAFGRGFEDYFSEPLGHAVYCIGLTADYLDRSLDTIAAHVTLFAELLEKAEFDSLTYLSSTRLYDGTDMPGRENGDLVLNPHNPRHLYDFSKGLGESLCLTGKRENVRTARLACVYAPDLKADNFLHGFLKAACEGQPMTLETHMDAVRDYVHIDDVCQALVEIATSGKRQIYNVASGENVSNRELFALVESLTGCTIEVTPPQVSDAPNAPRVNTEFLRDDFGLTPKRLADVLPEILSPHLPGCDFKVAMP